MWTVSEWNHYSTEPLGINHLFVFRMVTLLIGWEWFVCTLYVCQVWIHSVCEYVRWNPQHKQKWMAVEMSVSTHGTSYILHNDVKLDAYRCCVSHALTPRLREIRRACCAALLQQFKGGGGRNTETSSLQMRRFFLYRKNWIIRMTECMQVGAIKPGGDATGHTHAPFPICDGLL